MGNFAAYRGLMGLAIAIVLGGCQSQPATLPESDVPTQTVGHAMGTTLVPVRPERVVVIDTTPLDAAIALGIEPVGTIRYGAPPGYLEDRVSDIEVVGQYNQPNLEAILRLKPDLILGAKSISEQIYPRLSQIAPTVFTEGAGRDWDWKNNFRLFATALGESEQAEQLLTDYQQTATDLINAVEPAPENITVSVLTTIPEGLVAHTPTSFSGSILQELGFARNTVQANDAQFFVRLSNEDLEGPDGDIIFLLHSPEWETADKSEFINHPIWSRLKAVQQGAVCEVAADVWGSGRSILAAHQVLVDVENCLEQIHSR